MIIIFMLMHRLATIYIYTYIYIFAAICFEDRNLILLLTCGTNTDNTINIHTKFHMNTITIHTKIGSIIKE